MTDWPRKMLTGALTDPCPVCSLKPEVGVNLHGVDAEPDDGTFTCCFGCGLIQVIHNGMRCDLTDEEADAAFAAHPIVTNVLSIAKLRAKNAWRVGELVRDQAERQRRR